jgi:hypothetical protein
MERLKILIIVLVFAGGIYYVWNIVPPYFHNYEFQDGLDDIVRRASYVNITEDDLKQAVLNKAKAMDIAVKEDQIAVIKGNTGWTISVHYRVHVDMLVHPVDLDFQANSHNKALGT